MTKGDKMSSSTKSKKAGKVIAIVLACVIVLGAFLGVMIYLRNGNFFAKLSYDQLKGGTAGERVDTAQYIPDIDTFISVNSGAGSVARRGDGSNKTFVSGQEPTITKDEFQAIIDEFAQIDNYAGAGKYLGYDIYEIKNELAYVVKKVPAFNQWFRMPMMREEQGYVSIPYYESWAYYLELELDPLKLSVTRVCWATRSSFMDFDKKTFVEDYKDGSSIIQYEIMKTSYYTDENGDEVVEAHIYSVGIDHVKSNNYYNRNKADYHPYEYQYLKNVKDKTLVTYHITAAPRYSMYNNEEYFVGWSEDPDAGDDGMDVRGLTPYGIRREFKVVNYDGYQQIDILDIDQQFASLTNPTATGDVSFDLNSNNVDILAKSVGLAEEDYHSITDCKDFLDVISKHIVDNFELKENWPKIYAKSSRAIEVKLIKGPFYNKAMPITDVTIYTSCRGHYQEEIEFDAYAYVYDITMFDLAKEYSLSMALKERTTGKITVIATNYAKLTKRGGDYWELPDISIDAEADDILRIKEAGVYDITCVLTVKQRGQDVVLFDPLEVAYLRSYYGLKLNDLTDGGTTYKYDIASTGGRITLTVTEA